MICFNHWLCLILDVGSNFRIQYWWWAKCMKVWIERKSRRRNYCRVFIGKIVPRYFSPNEKRAKSVLCSVIQFIMLKFGQFQLFIMTHTAIFDTALNILLCRKYGIFDAKLSLAKEHQNRWHFQQTCKLNQVFWLPQAKYHTAHTISHTICVMLYVILDGMQLRICISLYH